MTNHDPIEPPIEVLNRLRSAYTIDTSQGLVLDVNGNSMGSLDRDGYHDIFISIGQVGRTRFRRSHIVFWAHHGRWPTKQLDHNNRVRDDDRINNLKEVTEREQQSNKTKASGLPVGVFAHKKSNGRFMAQIYKNGKTKYLGLYKTVEEASAVYQKEANS